MPSLSRSRASTSSLPTGAAGLPPASSATGTSRPWSTWPPICTTPSSGRTRCPPTAGPTPSWSATSTPPSSSPRTSAWPTCSTSWGCDVSTLVERLRGRSELGVSVLLAALGVLVLIDASRIPTDFTQRGPVGPAAVPVVVGVALLVIAVLLARDVLRGGHGESEAGEDIDLSHPS